MSTRAYIGKRYSDGSIRAVYCHSDGYFNGVGLTLCKFYKDSDKIEALINGGDMSFLGDTVEETKFYGNSEPLNFCTVFSFVQDAIKSRAEYIYIFDDDAGEWTAAKTPFDTKAWDITLQPLELSEN